jgi:septum formation protein
MMNLKYPLILASKSPRRHELLKNAGFDFSVQVVEIDEVVPDHVTARATAAYLAELKSDAHAHLAIEAIVLTADTTVLLADQVLGKPQSTGEAKVILSHLSGKSHEVITGVCLRHRYKKDTFSVVTRVHFDRLSAKEIDYYVEHYNPLDKAGAYGIQDWIGHIGIDKIEGSYYNVMGLPVQQIYQHLKVFSI